MRMFTAPTSVFSYFTPLSASLVVFSEMISAVMSASRRPERHQRGSQILWCIHNAINYSQTVPISPIRPGTDPGSGSTQQLVWLLPGWLAERLLWDLSDPAEQLTAAETAASHLTALHSIKGQRLTKDAKCVCMCACCVFSSFPKVKVCTLTAAFSLINLTETDAPNRDYNTTDSFMFTCFTVWKTERNMEAIDRPITNWPSRL